MANRSLRFVPVLVFAALLGSSLAGGSEPLAHALPATQDASAEEFVKDTVNYLTAVENPGATVDIGPNPASGANETAAIRNGMRNAVSWHTTNTTHELQGLSNLATCMSAFTLKEAYPHVSSGQQNIIRTNLKYFQRAVLTSQQTSSAHPAQYAIPVRPGVDQYSAKTNAVCGLALIELHYFWKTLAPSDTSLVPYRNAAKQAVRDIAIFLDRMQQPHSLPGMPSNSFSIDPLPDNNGDGIYDGIMEEIFNERLVMATATWTAMTGRFYKKLASLPWLTSSERDDLDARAEAMYDFYTDGLAVGAEHFSPMWSCTTASCADKFRQNGLSIATVSNYDQSHSTSRSGGDNAWHPRPVAFPNLNGSDSPQWVFNALYSIDPTDQPASYFDEYVSPGAKQVHYDSSVKTFDLLDTAAKRDIYLGLGTYIVHGYVNSNGTKFIRSSTGGDFAHYVKRNDEFQIVTSNYGDNAVSAWANAPIDEWASANEELLTESTLEEETAKVFLAGKYDFGNLSHLAHWAMVFDSNGNLQPKIQNNKMTIATENLASTMCRVVRAWKGLEHCTM